MLSRQAYKGAFLLVEGKDDNLFFRKFVNSVTCKIVVTETKDNVVQTIETLESRSCSGILGVVDADFDRIVGNQPRSKNVVLLETHDLETLLIRSLALDRVLSEFGSQQKIDRFARDIRETLAASAMSIACLRLHSLRSGLNLRFQGLRYSRFINRNSLSIDLKSFVQDVLNRSQRSDLSIEDLEAIIASIKCSGYDPWQMCLGDDLVSTLGLSLSKGALGTKSSREVSFDMLCQALRLAFCDDDFANTQLIAEVQSWEGRNCNFQVLKK